VDRSGRFRPRGNRTGSDVAVPAVPEIRALGFDFDHTLGIDNKLERVAFLRLAECAHAAGCRTLGSLAQESRYIDALLDEQRSGALTIEEAVRRFLEERGCGGADRFVDVYKRIALESVEQFVVPQPDVAEVLAALRARRIPYAILTNGWSPLQERKALRVSFDGPVLVSSELRMQKPAAGAFAALAAALGHAPQHIAYVGDAPAADVAGAQAAGMVGVWLDAEGARYPDDLAPACAIVHTLTELLTLV
jgi:HAD superfamily hydrolase (TIGR01509 family)